MAAERNREGSRPGLTVSRQRKFALHHRYPPSKSHHVVCEFQSRAMSVCNGR